MESDDGERLGGSPDGYDESSTADVDGTRDDSTASADTTDRDSTASADADATDRVSTGVDGLDAILQGGFFPRRNYMFSGGPGTGKTLFALEFLRAGVAADESVLFVNLEEDLAELRRNARRVGIDPEPMSFLDLSPGAEAFAEDGTYNVFEAAEVEREPLTDRIRTTIEESSPDRVVIDPISQFRDLTGDDHQFRTQIVGLSRFLKSHGATIVFTAKTTRATPSDDLQFLSDGNVLVERTDAGRRLSVPKFRGSGTMSGDHAFRITDDGLRVFPELAPGRSRDLPLEPISSGVPEVDQLLNGGLERGTITVIAGPTGVGKTTLGTQFMKEAAERGERSVVYLFEETRQTFLSRSEAVNIPVREMIERGTLHLEEIEALEMSPQEFAARVRDQVEGQDADIVMVDGLAGYEISLRGESSATRRRLHALGRYLKNQGVTTIMIDETSTVTGEFRATDGQISYLTDNIVFLRHLELDGELQKAIGVLKKRTSDFERTLREFEITNHGITVGEPLTNLRGVLSGTPERIDDD